MFTFWEVIYLGVLAILAGLALGNVFYHLIVEWVLPYWED